MEGSNSITISVMRKEFLDRLKLGAYYVGESVKGELQEVAAMLQASDDDDAVLTDYFREGNIELANILQKYMGKTTFTETTTPAANACIAFTISSVQNFNESNVSGLTNALYDYLVDFGLKEWSKPVPNTAQYYEEKLKEDTQAIREFCCHRKKPNRS